MTEKKSMSLQKYLYKHPKCNKPLYLDTCPLCDADVSVDAGGLAAEPGPVGGPGEARPGAEHRARQVSRPITTRVQSRDHVLTSDWQGALHRLGGEDQPDEAGGGHQPLQLFLLPLA